MTDGSPRPLLIVWHSRTGAAKQLAQAACDGALHAIQVLAAEQSVVVNMKPCAQVHSRDLLQAQAYLFCAPENLGALSGAMKECLDRHYYGVLDQVNGRPYSALIAAGSDGSGALRQLQRICTGWRLQAAYPGQIIHLQAQTPEQIMAPKTLDPEQHRKAFDLGANLCALLA